MQVPHSHWKESDEAAAWYEKPLHGAWHKGVSEVVEMARTYQWLNKSNIKANTSALIMAAQEQALNTRAVAHKIYHTVHDPWCISSTAATSSKGPITLKDNNVVEIVYRVICAEYNFERSKDWWIEPEK